MIIKKIISSLLVMSLVFGIIPFMGVMADENGNIAREATITASSNADKIYLISDGIKNSNDSRWTSTPVQTHWIELEWEEVQYINNVKMWSGSATGEGNQIVDFELLYWYRGGWVSIERISGNTLDGKKGQYNDIKFATVETNKLRIEITKGHSSYNDARVLELEVYTELSNVVTDRKIPIFSDDFEAEKHEIDAIPASPWEATGASTEYFSVQCVEDNKRVKVAYSDYSGDVSNSLQVSPGGSVSQQVVVKATVNVSDNAVQRSVIVRNVGTNGREKLVSFETSGQIRVADKFDLMEYDFDVDYNFMFIIDMTSMTYDIYINDMTTPFKSDIAFNQAAIGFTRMEFAFYAGAARNLTSVTYIDDIDIYNLLPLEFDSQPANNQTDVLPGTDMLVVMNDEFDFSTLNTENVTDNGADIIESIVTNESEPNRFWISLNENVEFDTQYTISLNNVKTKGLEEISDVNFTFKTVKDEIYCLMDAFQSADDIVGEPYQKWSTTGTVNISEDKDFNRLLSLQAGSSVQKPLSEEIELNSEGKVSFSYDIYTGGKRVDLTTTILGDTAEAPILGFNDSNKIVLFNNNAEVESNFDYSSYTTKGWLKDVCITIDIETGTYTATVGGDPISDAQGVLEGNIDEAIAKIQGLKFNTTSLTAGVDNIRLYIDYTDVINQILYDINNLTSIQAFEDGLSFIDSVGFGVDMDIYSQTDKSSICQYLYNDVLAGKQFEDLDALLDRVRVLTVVEAYNQSVSALIQDNKLRYLDVLGIDSEEIKKYTSNLSVKGLQNINENLIDKGFANDAAIKDRFRELLYTNLITNNNTSGINDTEEIINEHHSLLGLDYTKYLDYKNKDELHRQLVKSQVATPEELATSLLTIVKDGNKTSVKPLKGPGGGGITNIPMMSTTPSNQNTEQKVEKFTDLGNYQWASEAIYALRDKGIINGRGNSKFAPEAPVLREEFVKILTLAAELPSVDSKLNFKDVTGDKWFYKNIQTAVAHGVITGASEDLFGAGVPISRQDMAVILYRAAGIFGIKLDESMQDINVSDADSISDYAIAAVKALMGSHVINGYDDHTFKPFNQASRAEAAQMIYNFINLK